MPPLLHSLGRWHHQTKPSIFGEIKPFIFPQVHLKVTLSSLISLLSQLREDVSGPFHNELYTMVLLILSCHLPRGAFKWASLLLTLLSPSPQPVYVHGILHLHKASCFDLVSPLTTTFCLFWTLLKKKKKPTPSLFLLTSPFLFNPLQSPSYLLVAKANICYSVRISAILFESALGSQHSRLLLHSLSSRLFPSLPHLPPLAFLTPHWPLSFDCSPNPTPLQTT